MTNPVGRGQQPFSGGSGPTWNDAMIFAGQQQRDHPPEPYLPLWGAIAYSPQAGTFGWSSCQRTAEVANFEARSRGVTIYPGEPPKVFEPATVVATGVDVFLALAVAQDGSYGCGSHPHKPGAAERQARRNCPGRGARIVLAFGTRLRPASADSDIYAFRGTISSPHAIRCVR